MYKSEVVVLRLGPNSGKFETADILALSGLGLLVHTMEHFPQIIVIQSKGSVNLALIKEVLGNSRGIHGDYVKSVFDPSLPFPLSHKTLAKFTNTHE